LSGDHFDRAVAVIVTPSSLRSFAGRATRNSSANPASQTAAPGCSGFGDGGGAEVPDGARPLTSSCVGNFMISLLPRAFSPRVANAAQMPCLRICVLKKLLHTLQRMTSEQFLEKLQAHAAMFAKAVATNEGEWIIKGSIGE